MNAQATASKTQPPAAARLLQPLGDEKRGRTLKQVVVGRRKQHRIDVHLALGSIADVSCRAIMLGVFRDVAPTGPARVLNNLLDNAIVDFTRRRMFSANVGEVFIMPALRHRLRTEMVLFAGLGPFDGLNHTVQQIVAESAIRTCVRTGIEEFATVLFGAGSGQTIGESLESLLTGFLRGLIDSDRHHRFRSITLCEIDEERFHEMRQELYRLASTPLFESVEVTFDETVLSGGISPVAARAAVQRADPVYLIMRYEPARELFAAHRKQGRTEGKATANGRLTSSTAKSKSTLRTSLLTAGGKATVIHDVKQVSARKLNALLTCIQTGDLPFHELPSFGNNLAKLLLPTNVLQALQHYQNHHIVVVHDEGASRIPWETIHLDNWAPATKSGLSRRYLAQNMSIAKWLDQRRLGSTLSVLVVANPTGDLIAADREAAMLRDLLGGNSQFDFSEILRSQATHERLLAEFNSGSYDVIHYAGHAFFDERQRSRSGIVCADGKVLSGAELAGLSRLPSLICFNACEAARVRRSRSSLGCPVRERINRSVSFAEAYLRGGIANFIGTYWPVDDDGAAQFAQDFYVSILAGSSIGAALCCGRLSLHNSKLADWANYIHYGDHEFEVKAP